MNTRISSLIFWAALVIAVFGLKYDTLDEPYHWDTLHYMANAIDMYDHPYRVFHPPFPDLDHRHIPPEASRNAGHPPGILVPFVLMWQIFGMSIVVSHVFTIITGIFGLFLAYKLSAYYFNRAVGIGAVILILFNQIFFAQIGTAGDAMVLFAIEMLAVYLYSTGRSVWFAIVSSIMVLVKETTIVVVGAVFLHYVFKRFIENRKLTLKDAKDSWYILIAIVPLILWNLYFKAIIGFWTVFDGQMFGNRMMFPVIFSLDFVKYFLFDFTAESVNRFNFIISIFIVLTLFKLRKAKHKMAYVLFGLLIVAHITAFSWGHNLPRYFTPMLPFFYIIGAHAIHERLPQVKYKAVLYFSIIVVLAFLFTTSYTGNRSLPGFQLEANLEYLDMIETHKESAQYIEENYPDALVITSFPLTYVLTEPRHGYVTKPIQATRTTSNRSDVTLVYHSPQATTPDILDDYGENELTLLKRFEKRGKVAEVYIINE